ncbi:protein EFR3 homolog cmp44E isoform X2 [Ischnura elegans]|uniref:protein EFR3 homolog cmp44E isoform X2 n=1 Tax=Ischnura elegans TaxID=197161 RepID=UPI001ED88011|nr:protein EFR3 homolog cmp44E isoform X2 [Ischnura elegans]XP_046386954.1 protein EFR3 homolog cmp44E isoform X2 [Ischnura elegans]
MARSLSMGCCGCCSALRPRYKRLVDNIFPVNPQDGLVKNNMEKLTFYALSSPEKLDRIGEYLFQRASRDIYRRRNGFVIIAMEAMDQLLVACHAQNLNLFVESFLRMVQKLLESTEPKLQVLATQSFVRFANIEEDTPSYHRRYDFFISKFSSMCHSNHNEPELRDKIRLAGIKGLQGVVRKTVSDDLIENIWEAVHMDKIVPSLLFNMQNLRSMRGQKGVAAKGEGGRGIGGTRGKGMRMDEEDADDEVDEEEEEEVEERSDPPTLAETCLRELVKRASFGHIRSVLRPVLRHLDHHELWVPNLFAVHTFKIIMISIQAQYSYTVIETLMAHLDDNSKSSPKIRTSIADVLSKIISIAAGESVGPSVLEIINSLLTHLRQSVMREVPSRVAEESNAGEDESPEEGEEVGVDERLYQEALINALGEFANHLPDYQKIEIMMFIMSKVPHTGAEQARPHHHHRHHHRRGYSGPGDALLQNILLKSLLKVGTKYCTVHFNTTFPLSFLEPLLRMSLAPDPTVRLLVQQILHTLVDRHHNLDKLLKPTINVADLDLTLEKCSRPDIIFARKHGPAMHSSLHESLEQPGNTAENVEAVYTTVALLCTELACEDTVADFLRLLISIQDTALTNASLSTVHKYYLHSIVMSLFVLVAHAVPIPPIMEYAHKVATSREEKAPQLLPPLLDSYSVVMVDEVESSSSSDTKSGPLTISPDLLLDQTQLAEHLLGAGFDPARLHQAPSYSGLPRHSWVDSSAAMAAAAATGIRSSSSMGADLNSLSADADSTASSPGILRKHPGEEMTFEAIKKVLSDSWEKEREGEEEERCRQLCHTFRNADFDELVSRTQTKQNDALHNKLNEIFGRLSSAVGHPDNYMGRSPAPQLITASSSPFLGRLHQRRSSGGQMALHNNSNSPPPAYEILFPELFVY